MELRGQRCKTMQLGLERDLPNRAAEDGGGVEQSG